MIYLPTTYDPSDPHVVIGRSAAVDVDAIGEGVTIHLAGPQGDYEVDCPGGALVYGPYIIAVIASYAEDIPAGEYTYTLVYSNSGTEIERGVARVGAIPAGATQYETNYNVKEYE